MNVEGIRYWQWVVVGMLVAGIAAMVGVGRPQFDPHVLREGMTPQQFLMLLNSRQPDQTPLLQNVLVYPPVDGKVVIVGRYAPAGKPKAVRSFETVSRVPFVAPGELASRSDGFTIRNYLDELRQKDSSIVYRYAWWAERRSTATLSAVSALVAIGLFWPLLLRAMIALRMGRRHAPAGVDVQAGPQQDLSEVAAVADAMEQQLAESVTTASSGEAATASRADELVRELSEGPLTPVLSEHSHEAHAYRGEYYPVALPDTHKEAVSAASTQSDSDSGRSGVSDSSHR